MRRRRTDDARRLAPLGLSMVALGLAADGFGCSRDHGVLAASGPASAAASGGGGAASTSAVGGGGSTSSASGGATAGVGGSNEGAGPTGPARVTVLDGVADSKAIRVCFLPYPAGDPTARPWPASAAGLAFGSAQTIALDGSVIPTGTDVAALVVGGDLSLSAGMTCDEIVVAAGAQVFSGSGGGGSGQAGNGGAGGNGDVGGNGGNGGAGGAGGSGGGPTATSSSSSAITTAGAGGAPGAGGNGGAGGAGGGPPPPPAILIASVGVLQASTFTSGRSLLLTPAGCLGGPGHDSDQLGTAACGAGYTSTTPTATLVALALSRITDDASVALQIVHASTGTPELYVTAAESMASTAMAVAQSLRFGAAQPDPPYAGFKAADISGDGFVTTYDARSAAKLLDVNLSTILAQGDVGRSGFANGHAYALVAIGASAAIPEEAWWNGFTYVAIRSDP